MASLDRWTLSIIVCPSTKLMATELPQNKFNQPRLNGLLRGRINKSSLGALVNVSCPAGLIVKVGSGNGRRESGQVALISNPIAAIT